MDVKTNEIPCLRTVLDQITDLKDVLITADALHCQTAHITYLLGRGAHLLVCAKGNQPGLLNRLKALPWKQVPVGHTSTSRAHGRIEERTLKVVTVTEQAGGLGFPGAAQAIQITRRTKRITPKPGKKNAWRTETVYAIVTLPAEQASPAELATRIGPIGSSRTACTGSATSLWVRISIRPAPGTARTSWRSYATS